MNVGGVRYGAVDGGWEEWETGCGGTGLWYGGVGLWQRGIAGIGWGRIGTMG